MKKTFLIFVFGLLYSQWSHNPSNPITIGTGIMPEIATLDDGGLVVSWLTAGDFNIYLQRFDPQGNPVFQGGGILVSNQPVDSWIAVHHLNLDVDSEGNAIITTVDMRTGTWEIYAYKLDPNGNHLWGETGLPLSSTGTVNISPRMVVDRSTNHTIVTWVEDYSTIFMQCIDSEGNLLWGNSGIDVSEENASLLNPEPKAADDGNYLIQWIRQTGVFPLTDSEVQVGKINNTGSFIVAPVSMGPAVSFPMGNWTQDLETDGSGGWYSSWTELAGNAHSAFVNGSDGNGDWLWNNPLELSDQSSHFRTNPIMTGHDPSGGVYVVWGQTDGNQVNRGLYGQRILPDGTVTWQSNGIPIESLGSNVFFDTHIGQAENDMLASYIKESGGGTKDIYASRLDEDGAFSWDETIIQLTVNGTDKSDLNMGTGNNCQFVTWSENNVIKAHCLRNDGTLGEPPVQTPGIIQVPDDFATIQVAINNSIHGDTILVSPGIYYENLNFGGKNILLTSYILLNDNPAYMYSTIVDGNDSGSVMVFDEGESGEVRGLTIQNGVGHIADPDGNGTSSDYGAGIYCENASPTFRDCMNKNTTVEHGGGGGFFGSNSQSIINRVTFDNNVSNDVGAAIYVRANSDIIIEDCVFTNNHCADVGGALYARDESDVQMSRTLIHNNTSDHAGAGVGFKNNCRPVFTHVTITNNDAAHYGGSIYVNTSFPLVVNSILWENGGGEVYFATFDDSSSITVSHSDITGGENGITTSNNGSVVWLEGNIDDDPLFLDTLATDYSLHLNSPCRDAGTEMFVLDGDTLFYYLDGDYSDDAPDMGAIESPAEIVTHFPVINDHEWVIASQWDTVSISMSGLQVNNDTIQVDVDSWYPDWGTDTLTKYWNRIFVFQDTVNTILYDFGTPIGSSWVIPHESNPTATMTLEAINDTVTTPEDDIYPCYRFYYYIAEDYGYYDWFAPGVGLVQRDYITVGGPFRYQLIEAGPVVANDQENIVIPDAFKITGVFPNPFNPLVTLSYSLHAQASPIFTVYDINGRVVYSEIPGIKHPGFHSISWNGKSTSGETISTGIYFAQISVNGKSNAVKMMYLK